MINMTKTLDIASTPQDAILLDTMDGTYSYDAPQGRVELNGYHRPPQLTQRKWDDAPLIRL